MAATGNHFLLPLIIPPGVTLEGDYDLLSEPTPDFFQTNPNGTLFYSNNYRHQYDLTLSCNTNGISPPSQVFLFALAPAYTTGGASNYSTTIRNIRLHGSAVDNTDYNTGFPASNEKLFCGGIILPENCYLGCSVCTNPFGYNYLISHCEVSGFNAAGVWISNLVDEIQIDHTYVHHISHNAQVPSGYEIWSNCKVDQTIYDILLSHNLKIIDCIFDDGKNSWDATATSAFNVDFINNSETQFSGGINRHNNTPTHFPHPPTSSGCQIFKELYEEYRNRDNPVNNYCKSQCESADVIFGIDDCTQGSTTISNSIFNNSTISMPYPGRYGLKKINPYPNLLTPNGSTVYDLADNSSLLAHNANNIFLLPLSQTDAAGWDVSSFLPANFLDVFDYLGQNDDFFFISSNGFVKLGNANPNYSDIFTKTPYDFPDDPLNPHAPHNIVALCWTPLDLQLSNGATKIKCWYDSVDNLFVIEWDNVYTAANNALITGQIIFYGANNAGNAGSIGIRLQDQDMPASYNTYRLLGIIGESGNSGSVPKLRNTYYKLPDDPICTFHDNYWNLRIQNIPTPEAWIAKPPVTYKDIIQNNTFATAPISGADNCDQPSVDAGHPNVRKGYAQISNNYIGACLWQSTFDQNVIQSQNNTIGYNPGTEVNTGCPQPPEANLDLADLAGNSLPVTSNYSQTSGHVRTQHAIAGTPFKLKLSAGQLGSQNPAYIVRTNPSTGAVVQGAATNTVSCNNNYNDDKRYLNGNTAGTQITYNDAGLHGIDVLAVDAGGAVGSKKYYTSKWQHIPVIIPSVNHHLIFNIKDSYKEFHHLLAYGCCSTGVFKQVELNGIPIWKEDIAFGGDGWELVDIDLTQPNSVTGSNTPMLSLITTNGTPNVLSFSIVIDQNAIIETNKVKGVLVWIDDIYLKKADTEDNLITEGDIEKTPFTTDLINTYSLEHTWYKRIAATFNCSPLLSISENGSGMLPFYPDGVPIEPGRATVDSRVGVTMSVRKSGAHSLVLVLPALSPVACTTYTVPANGIAASAATQFDFRGLFGCDAFGNSLNGPLIGTNIQITPIAYTYADVYRCSGLTIGNGSTQTDVTMNGCVISMDPNAQIIVTKNATLTLHRNGTITGKLTSLFACSDMWRGIIVQPGGTLVINDSVSISDAITAISCQGDGITEPELKINAGFGSGGTEVIFDHNYTGIELLQGNYQNFHCFATSFLCTGGFLSKAPARGEITNSHFIAKDAEGIIMGAYGVGNGHVSNKFEDSHFGIQALNSSLTVWHSDFKNISLNDDSFEPSAIFAMADIPHALNIGDVYSGTANNYRNSFTNCSKGINVLGNVESNIIRNDFSNNLLDILQSNNTLQSITIQENNFDSAFNSIMLFDNTTQQAITVTGNNLKSRHDEAGVPAGKHGIGIYYAYNAKLNLNVDQNDLSDFPLGIRIINADKLSNSIFNVTQNTINFNFDESRLGENLYRGIFMSNSSGAKVAENTITWNSELINPADINSHADQVQGMRMEKVQTSDIKDNMVTTCGTGMFMYDDCSGIYFTCNHFQDNYPGIEFSQTTLPPAQGGLCQPAFNTWNGTYSAAFPKNIASGICSPFLYYYSGPTLNNPEHPLPGPTIINPVNIGNCVPLNPCTNNHNGNLMADDTIKKDEELQKIVDHPAPTSPDDFAAETEYKKQEYAYSTMQEIPALVNSADRVDFMDSTGQNNIGKLKEVKDLMLAGDSMQAATKNNLIVDSNLIESNKKTANNINLSTDTLTASDSIVANGIAYQLAIQGGEAVYWMRGKLRLDIEDVLPAMRKAKIVGDESKPTVHGKLFPIPATERVTFSYEHAVNSRVNIIVADALGQALKNYFLNNNTIEFSVSSLANGFYYVKVCEDGIEKEEHKLTVIR
ncbi:MAG: T9SS type A sorting domain-containing protein [Bacteroidetes bacterium]|nr:T9SS type A sorting domain-containing protein [Bacteroidota bacterium]